MSQSQEAISLIKACAAALGLSVVESPGAVSGSTIAPGVPVSTRKVAARKRGAAPIAAPAVDVSIDLARLQSKAEARWGALSTLRQGDCLAWTSARGMAMRGVVVGVTESGATIVARVGRDGTCGGSLLYVRDVATLGKAKAVAPVRSARRGEPVSGEIRVGDVVPAPVKSAAPEPVPLPTPPRPQHAERICLVNQAGVMRRTKDGAIHAFLSTSERGRMVLNGSHPLVASGEWAPCDEYGVRLARDEK